METSNHQHQATATTGIMAEALSSPALQLQHHHQQERKLRPPPSPEQALSCPRCNSTNTKFCYYNNYSLSQPRYFCKGCRRYWTHGGTLRNVPVGGGCRKNKRSSSSSCNKKAQDQNNYLPNGFGGLLIPSLPPPPPPLMFDPHDLTLAFSTLHDAPGLDGHDEDLVLGNANPSPIPHQAPGFLDILRTGFLDGGASCSLDDLYYYGVGGRHGNAEEGGRAGGERAMTPYEGPGGATPSTGQESSCKRASTADGDNRLLMGQQWQVGGDGGMVLVDPAGRDCWNGAVGYSGWHGLVNSSLI